MLFGNAAKIKAHQQHTLGQHGHTIELKLIFRLCSNNTY